MNLRRTNGGLAFGQLRDEMDKLFEDFFGPASALQRTVGQRTFPALNVWEDGDRLLAEAELPGVRREDLEIAVVGNEVTLKGKRSVEHATGLTFHRRERGTGEFARTVKLPVAVDPDKVEASLQDGVLHLVLPKAEAAKPRKINVKTS